MLSCCRIDTEMKYGQVRVLDESAVSLRVQDLSSNPPAVLLHLCVWQEPSMLFVFTYMIQIDVFAFNVS